MLHVNLDDEDRALIGLGPQSRELVLVEPGKTEMIGGAFEGADRFNRELAMYQPAIRSADGDLLPEKGLLDARVRDSLRNDGYMQAGAAIHKDNIVGAMFLLNATPDQKVLGLEDDKWEQEFQEEVEAKFTIWAESQNNWPDASRTNTFTALVRLAIGVYVATGEVLATAEWLRDKPRTYSTAIQMIDLDRLSTPFDKKYDPTVRAGIQQNRFGAPQGFYIRTTHPSDFDRMSFVGDWDYVPIRKPWGRLQVIHIKEQMRVDQTRGVADLVAALKTTHITRRFRDITLQNAVTGAMFAASIESDLPDEAVFQSLGQGSQQTPGGAVAAYGTEYLKAVAAYTGDSRSMFVDGVKIPHFFPGTKLQLRPVGTPGGVGQEFEQSLLRHMAASLGVSYEQLSKDYSNANYATARASGMETWKFMQSRKRIVADRFGASIYGLWFEEAMNGGNIEAMKSKKIPNFYEGLNREAYTSCSFIGAARGQIDELKETQAALLRVKGRLSTDEDELARVGKDWRRVYKQLQREKELRAEMGIEELQDNSLNAASGTPTDARDSKGGAKN